MSWYERNKLSQCKISPRTYIQFRVCVFGASRTEFCDNRGHPSVDERLPVHVGYLRVGGGGCFHLLQPRYEQEQAQTEVNTMLQPLTGQHVGKHWAPVMLQIYKRPQHQHLPAHCAGKRRPLQANTARRAVILVAGFPLAASYGNQTLQRSYWLGGVTACDDSNSVARHKLFINKATQRDWYPAFTYIMEAFTYFYIVEIK